MSTPTIGNFRRADSPADFVKFGIDPQIVAPWEDGPRVGQEPGCFEWWYFDAILSNGVSVVVFFFTKPFSQPENQLSPIVSISIKLPNSNNALGVPVQFDPSEFKVSANKCDVRIAGNSFSSSDLATYYVEAAVGELAVKMKLSRSQSDAPPIRIGTGHLLFKREGRESYFGWLAPVPRGQVEIEYTIGGVTVPEKGFGYHDHNWGNADMATLMHDWYWARAEVGSYTIVVAHTTMQPNFGSLTHTDLVLVKDGSFIALGSANVVFEKDEDQISPDPETGKPVAHLTRYIFDDGVFRCVVSFQVIDILKRHLFDTDGAYHRFSARCDIEVTENGVKEILSPGRGLMELMWLGSAPTTNQLQIYAHQFARARTL
jgi:hypothetical protein